jgi:prophage DNA circulation protein
MAKAMNVVRRALDKDMATGFSSLAERCSMMGETLKFVNSVQRPGRRTYRLQKVGEAAETFAKADLQALQAQLEERTLAEASAKEEIKVLKAKLLTVQEEKQAELRALREKAASEASNSGFA